MTLLERIGTMANATLRKAVTPLIAAVVGLIALAVAVTITFAVAGVPRPRQP